MAESLRSLFLKVRALLDEHNEEGIIIADEDVIELQVKSIPLFDIAHKEVYEIARLDSEVDEPTNLSTIEDLTEVNYKADQAILYYVAARLAPFENKELVQYFEDEWARLLRKCANKATEVAITDVYTPTE